MKTFTRAGRSTYKGKTLFRFTNDLQRERVLDKNGHTNIVFYELGEPLTKAQAIEFLVAKGLTEDTPADTASKRHTQPAKTERKSAPVKAQTVLYDEHSKEFERLVAEKRQAFPSHSEEQLMELVHFQAQANQKAFNSLEVPF